MVDQMRGDYVDKFQHQWTSGLQRLVTDGAWFRQADYPYFNTVTCAGHAIVEHRVAAVDARHDPQRLVGSRSTASDVHLHGDDPRSPNLGYGKPVTAGDSARAAAHVDARRRAARAAQSSAAASVGVLAEGTRARRRSAAIAPTRSPGSTIAERG